MWNLPAIERCFISYNLTTDVDKKIIIQNRKNEA